MAEKPLLVIKDLDFACSLVHVWCFLVYCRFLLASLCFQDFDDTASPVSYPQGIPENLHVPDLRIFFEPAVELLAQSLHWNGFKTCITLISFTVIFLCLREASITFVNKALSLFWVKIDDHFDISIYFIIICYNLPRQGLFACFHFRRAGKSSKSKPAELTCRVRAVNKEIPRWFPYLSFESEQVVGIQHNIIHRRRKLIVQILRIEA